MAKILAAIQDSLSFAKEQYNSGLRFVAGLNTAVNKSTFGRIFRLRGSGHPHEIRDANFATEIRAGLTTFATMAYIIAVNASILSDTGGTCISCKNEIKRDLITATAAISGLATTVFGLFTNLPVALAPGMGLNAFFTYQVVGYQGQGPVSYRLALTAVFVEGWIFVFLAVTGMRLWLVKVIPNTIKTASGVGIGMFLTLIGMSYGSGIGIVTGSAATPLTLGGCPSEALSDNGECSGQIMASPKMWIGIMFGGILTACMMAFRVKAAIILGIILVSVISWPRNTPITYFPHTTDGDSRFAFFKKVVSFHPIQHTLVAQQWDVTDEGSNGAHFALALFTFLYVDIVDCTATLYSMARFCNKTTGRSADRGDFPRSTVAYCTDAICISIGALLGCSPVTVFVESGSGIAEGGRTGLTAIVTGFCFLLSLFFAPIFASIPPWATGCTLILVGCLMMRQVTRINWAYIGDAVPSFVTLCFIPFSYSVAYGLIAGLFTYAGLNCFIRLMMFCSRGTVRPPDYDQKEYWSWKPEGERPWIFRIFSRRRANGGEKDSKFWGHATIIDNEEGEEMRTRASLPDDGRGGVNHHDLVESGTLCG
ncbi:hypothetical protein VTK73DRAFT_5323 [Phialemonium thermophilum]|uniref:Uncharacterized protein n=1 Tax=Phialemonium thermophilum TaxID=223376 RepID=A0ABR3Y8U8_9PEZI